MSIHITKYTDAEWAQIGIEVLERSMRRGDVAAIRGSLASENRQRQVGEHGGAHGIAVQAKAKEWLVEAEAYETVHGVDSRLDKNDPYVRDMLLPGRDRFRKLVFQPR